MSNDTRQQLDLEARYAILLHFVKSVAGDGYLSTRATAQDVLAQVGEDRYPRTRD